MISRATCYVGHTSLTASLKIKATYSYTGRSSTYVSDIDIGVVWIGLTADRVVVVGIKTISIQSRPIQSIVSWT